MDQLQAPSLESLAGSTGRESAVIKNDPGVSLATWLVVKLGEQVLFSGPLSAWPGWWAVGVGKEPEANPVIRPVRQEAGARPNKRKRVRVSGRATRRSGLLGAPGRSRKPRIRHTGVE